MKTGWIKIDKDLPGDPRVLKVAARMEKMRDAGALHPVTQERFSQNNCVTQVIGALLQLWIYADTFAKSDDVLELSADQINAHVGIPNFCEILPKDWMEIMDDSSVKLPGYQAHNGTMAKHLAQAAQRQTRYRHKLKRSSVTPRNATASPDRDRDRDHNNSVSPDGLNTEVWHRWLAYRKKSGKTIKPESIEAAQRKLAGFGSEQAAVVEHSIAEGYQGLFAPKTSKSKSEPEKYKAGIWPPPEDSDALNGS